MRRRAFLIGGTGAALLFLTSRSSVPASRATGRSGVTLFLCGDVMTGRGVDQLLPHSVDPELHEPYVEDARMYVELAESEHGALPDEVGFGYVWGEALAELERAGPDLRIANLETAVTSGGEPWPGKGIHYRMHPGNVPVLAAAGLDVCVLSNNHVLDWGRSGFEDTLSSLEAAGLGVAGAGRDARSAAAPARATGRGGARVLVFGFGHASSGIPAAWEAGPDRGGVALLPDLSSETARRVAGRILRARRAARADLVVVSVHWGRNWGYDVPDEQRAFAHALVEESAADIVHGHSSHHPKGIEVHEGRLVLYGCGDFLNDYEGISGHEAFRPELTLMYLPELDPATGALRALEMVPMRIRRFRLERARPEDARWLARTVEKASRTLGGARVTAGDDGRLSLGWAGRPRPR